MKCKTKATLGHALSLLRLAEELGLEKTITG
jgi:hypothetical protein